MAEMNAETVDAIRREMGLKRLNPTWAKLEIVIGLTAVAIAIGRMTDDAGSDVINSALFVLGLYFAMAGHRSHLYQAMNRQTAFIVTTMRSHKPE